MAQAQRTAMSSLDGNGIENNASGSSSAKESAIVKLQVKEQPAEKLSELRIPRYVFEDHFELWTSPARTRTKDLVWVLPSAAIVTGSLLADKSIERRLPENASVISRARSLSDIGVGGTLALAGGMYIWGRARGDSHATETGILSAEAVANAFMATTELKFLTGRQRPGEGGSWGHPGWNRSFPSQHAAIAWSLATVVSHEYPGWMTKTLAFGGASAISAFRVTGKEHFVTDVLVGSVLGYVSGRQALKRSRYASEPWGQSSAASFDSIRDPREQGSSYVPLDSWVYTAFDRLSALGHGPNGFQNMRPWTRLECARMLENTADLSAGDSLAKSILQDLQEEFAEDTRVYAGGRNLNASIESVYTRVVNFSGRPLTDGMHFGQSIINDYGRPYESGWNVISGLDAHANAGPIAFYLRAEYQHAPSASPLPDSVRSAVAASESLPVAPATSVREISRVRLLDSYVALNVKKWQLSFGKQSLWWGPGAGSDLTLSNNAEPITMLRLTRATPLRLPGIAGYLGDVRSDTFVGQVSGYHFLRLTPEFVLTGSYDRLIDPQPYIWGHKLAFQPTSNLQFGVSWTTIFAGLGRPLTMRTFLHSFSSRGNAQAVEPGDRRAGFDFSYRVPGLRRWLVVYNGAMSEDELSPLAYPLRSAMNPGIYLPQVPGLRRLDVRVETGYTNPPNSTRAAVFYRNTHYAGGFTNNGDIMGSWLGPQARGYQVLSNYWRSAQSKIQFSYRRQTVDPSYIGGGTLQDFAGKYDFFLRSSVKIQVGVQYERWAFPTLSSHPQSNLASSVELSYRPGDHGEERH